MNQVMDLDLGKRQLSLFYLQVPYGDKVLDYYIKQGDHVQKGVYGLPDFLLYDSTPFEFSCGNMGSYTLHGHTLDDILKKEKVKEMLSAGISFW